MSVFIFILVLETLRKLVIILETLRKPVIVGKFGILVRGRLHYIRPLE